LRAACQNPFAPLPEFSARRLRTPMKLLLIVAMIALPLLASSAENREYVILLDEL
jgi:hypothetical protein